MGQFMTHKNQQSLSLQLSILRNRLVGNFIPVSSGFRKKNLLSELLIEKQYTNINTNTVNSALAHFLQGFIIVLQTEEYSRTFPKVAI